MKKALAIFFVVTLTTLSGLAQTQNQGDTRIHAFGTYGLQWKESGLGVGLEFFFVEHFALMPSYTRIFPRVGSENNFSADLRYYVSEGASQLYFMAGFSQTWQNNQSSGGGVNQKFNGANVGVGAYIRLVDWVGLSTEFRFTSTRREEVGFRVGFAFPLRGKTPTP